MTYTEAPMKKISIALALTLIAGALAAWQSQETKARIPEFPMKALAMAGATRANFFISKDGTITRYAVHVGPEAMPEWITKMADEKIGKGEDLEYEMELYPDGSEVFEVYRKVQGKEMQLSVHADKSVKYVGREMDPKELPGKVGAGLRGVKGFTAEKAMFKEGPKFAEYHIKGNLGGTPHRVRLSGDGRLLSVQRKLAGEFELAVQE
jgi:hypothetical protein